MILQPSIHPKGWGSEEWIYNSELYCAKVLRVREGKQCSLHYHKRKTETMYIVQGKILMIYGDEIEMLKETTLTPGDAFHIKPNLLHRFKALEDSVIHEFSTQHFEEDSYRVVKGD